MSAIPDELIEQIRDAADVVEIIGERVDLRRTGSDYRGPCPFHGGTHRNLAVIPKKQMFYCFVCHEGGDVFAFYMKTFGMDYPQAVREVAGKVGIHVPERSTGGPDPREPLYTALAVAAEWYAKRLRESDDAASAREYLAGRAFEPETLSPLGLGFAPKGPVFLEAMAALGITDDALLAAGLAVRREDESVRPRFWGRLLFPIHDIRGRVVGFGGRVLGNGEPKYLNSPESEVFHKGGLLYNLHSAKNAIRRAGRAIVVEGYFDVLRTIEAGLDYVVAPLGTALTDQQAQLLKRYASEIVLLYDSDAAGLRATFRAADELLRVSARPLIATPPPGEDPDTVVVRGGKKALAAVIDDAMDVLERKLQLIDRKGWLGSVSGRRRALDRLLSTLRAATDGVTRDLYVGQVAERLGVTAESVRREMEQGRFARRPAATPQSARPETRKDPDRPSSGQRLRPERHLIEVMIREPSWRSRIAEQIQEPKWLNQPERDLFELLAGVPSDMTNSDLIRQVEGPARTMVQELLSSEWHGLNVDEVVEGAISRIQSRPLEAKMRNLQRKHDLVSEAEKDLIQREIGALRTKINELNRARWGVIRS